MKSFKKTALATLALALAVGATSPALADAYCDGKIVRIYIDTNGVVNVLPTFRNEWISVCGLESPWKNVGINTCQGWLSNLTSGMLSGRSFTFYYDGATSDCSAIPAYGTAPAPVYVMLHQ